MTRLLPIDRNTDVVSLVVESGGARLPGFVPVSHVEIVRQLNRIPYARLRIADGDAAAADFPVSSGEFFVPGREVVISAGYHGDADVLFEGIVVKQRLGVRDDASWLEVECRDVTSRMTLTRRHRQFEDVTDSDVVEELLSEYGIDAHIAPSDAMHGQLLQYQATDWDFMISRLEANGQVCAVENGAVRSFVPSQEDVVDARVVFGSNLLELDAEFDARAQARSVKASAWNAAEQALQALEAEDPGWTPNGDLSTDDMVAASGRELDELWHGGTLSGDALQAWANGALLRSRLAGSRGRARVRGLSRLALGQMVSLGGTSGRFNGQVLTTGIRHQFSDNDWCTDVEFGGDGELHAERFRVSSLPASGLSPAVSGLQTGVVTAIAGDPADEHRIRVRIPVAGMDQDGIWARLATLDAGNGRGTYFRPEVDDEVVLGFLHDDPAFPVVLGMLHSSARPPPEEAAENNHLKGYTSRDGLRLVFDDENGAITLETPESNRIVLNDGDGGITISDQNGNRIVMSSDGIDITSDGNIGLVAGGDFASEGSNVELKAGTGFKAEGSASAELSSSGTLTVSGSLVQIN